MTMLSLSQVSLKSYFELTPQESSVFLESSQTIANRIYSNTCGSLYSSGVSSTMIASRSTGTRRDS